MFFPPAGVKSKGETIIAEKKVKYLIIIPTYNRRDDLRETIRTMPFLKDSEEFRLVVVDDCSTDGTAEMLREEFPYVDVIRNEQQTGPAAGRNKAAFSYDAEYYIFLDSDIEVPENWQQTILEHIAPDRVLAGKVVNLYSKEVETGPRRSTFIGGSVPCSPEQANVGSSCHMVVPAACYRAIGGFDEEIPYYFEDSDLSIRANKAGFPVTFIDEAVVYHKNQGHKRGKRIQMHVQNRTYAMSKAYEKNPLKLSAFFVLNSVWVFLQSVLRIARMEFSDSLYILRGWVSGNRKFIRRLAHNT